MVVEEGGNEGKKMEERSGRYERWMKKWERKDNREGEREAQKNVMIERRNIEERRRKGKTEESK